MKTITYLLLISLLMVSCKEEKIVYVADHYGNCDTQCLLIRENENENWIKVNNQIENFDYQEGYTYQLKISITKKDSKLKYQLLEVLSKTKTIKKPVIKGVEKKWYITSIKGFSNKTNKVPYFLIKEGKITGNSGCNTFGGKINYKSGNFKISEFRKTDMYCEEFASLERAVNKSLGQAVFYKITDGLLFVLDKSKYVLLTAKDSNARHISPQHVYKAPYTIKYNYITSKNIKREISIEEIKNTLIITDFADTKTTKKITLTKSELKYFNDYFKNLDFNQLEKMIPINSDNPINVASLNISYHGKMHKILNFNKNTPPKQLRDLIDMINKLGGNVR
jgi:heat shock protein HslJ